MSEFKLLLVPTYSGSQEFKLVWDTPNTKIDLLQGFKIVKDQAEEISKRYNAYPLLIELVDLLIGGEREEAMIKMQELGLIK